MLSKNICMNCVDGAGTGVLVWLCWSDRDDVQWDRGAVWCPLTEEWELNDKISPECRYKFEHAVALRMTDAE